MLRANDVKGTLPLWSSPTKPKSQPTQEQNTRQMPLVGLSTKLLTSTPQNCQSHQKPRKLETLPSQEAPKETRGLKGMQFTEWDPDIKRGH